MLEVVLKGPGGSVHVLKNGRAVGARGQKGYVTSLQIKKGVKKIQTAGYNGARTV